MQAESLMLQIKETKPKNTELTTNNKELKQVIMSLLNIKDLTKLSQSKKRHLAVPKQAVQHLA
ncbi:hypothetical protein [Synechococcus sp. MVIR-18-1]|uniref:hypothetical protein n=1 Tax=Synechococcus sp. MVIR-18-1 TaxID=1386941 RepID=UPI0016490066|nr:hypothetical protein [Synechococcus sp. MVIR-18-1]